MSARTTTNPGRALGLVWAAALVVLAALMLTACGAPASPLDDASDAQVSYYNAYTDSAAPDAFGGTYEQAIELGDAACSDLDDGMSVANILGGADPATLDASKAVVAAAGTYLCPEHAEQVAALTEGN